MKILVYLINKKINKLVHNSGKKILIKKISLFLHLNA